MASSGTGIGIKAESIKAIPPRPHTPKGTSTAKMVVVTFLKSMTGWIFTGLPRFYLSWMTAPMTRFRARLIRRSEDARYLQRAGRGRGVVCRGSRRERLLPLLDFRAG